MKRVLALWLPNWPIQRLVANRPELAGRPLALHAASRRGQYVAARSREAAARGVEVGMPLVEAKDSLLLPHDPAADRTALVELAQWCHRFSPTVGFEEGETPETLLLDATNLAPLYGSEEELVRQLAHAMKRRRLEARLALADTIGAAWGLSHYAQKSKTTAIARGASPGFAERDVQNPGLAPGAIHDRRVAAKGALKADANAFAELPLAALRLEEELLATLAALGLENVGQVLVLPRDQLRSRFGPQLLLRIDQLFGAAAETMLAVSPPEGFVVERQFEFPLAERTLLARVVEELAQRLAWSLTARSTGALAVCCRFECEAAPAIEFDVGLFQPSASARHLHELLALRMERIQLPAAADGVVLYATRHALLAEQQQTLFEHDRSLDGSVKLAALVDRLAGRLGREAVFRCRLASDAQPELACREEPLVGVAHQRSLRHGLAATRRSNRAWSPVATERRAVVLAAGAAAERKCRKKLAEQGPGELLARGLGGPSCSPLHRPTRLLTRPLPIEAMAVAPDGPPIRFLHAGRQHNIAHHWGPERVETGWWRRRTAARDYYRVETTEGRRWWLFRELRSLKWFLHGVFE